MFDHYHKFMESFFWLGLWMHLRKWNHEHGNKFSRKNPKNWTKSNAIKMRPFTFQQYSKICIQTTWTLHKKQKKVKSEILYMFCDIYAKLKWDNIKTIDKKKHWQITAEVRSYPHRVLIVESTFQTEWKQPHFYFVCINVIWMSSRNPFHLCDHY